MTDDTQWVPLGSTEDGIRHRASVDLETGGITTEHYERWTTPAEPDSASR